MITAIDQIAMLAHIDESNHDGSSTVAPAATCFDVVGNITLDLYQRQCQECEEKKTGAH
jgi:hypothetical protein